MAHTADISILGTGIVGMSLALSLARARLRVNLVGSIAAPHHPDVRAYAINHAGRATLQAVDAWPDDDLVATPVRQMRVFGDAQGCVQFDAPVADSLTWIVDVPTLIDRLQTAVKAHALITVTEAATAAPLRVICEGRDTASRAAAGLTARSMAYPHHAVATRVRADQGHAGTAWQWFDGERILGLLPLGGPGGQELAVVWSQAGAQARAWPHQTPEALGEALSQASHHVLGHLHVNAPVATWPLVLSRATRWVAPGVALAGDAAHSVHPLAGQGLNLGLADVAELTRVIAGRERWRGVGDYALLRRYERARALPTRLMQAGTDGLYLSFASDWPAAAALRNVGMQWFDRWSWLKNAAMAHARHAR